MHGVGGPLPWQRAAGSVPGARGRATDGVRASRLRPGVTRGIVLALGSGSGGRSHHAVAGKCGGPQGRGSWLVLHCVRDSVSNFRIG